MFFDLGYDIILNIIIFKIINIVLVQAIIKQSSLVHYIDYTKTLMT